jgi:hypothetical protein
MDNELFTGVDRPAVLGTGLPQLLAVVKIVYENRMCERMSNEMLLRP